MNLKKNGKVFTSKFVRTGPSSYEKRIYRAAVSQRLRNTELGGNQLSPNSSQRFATAHTAEISMQVLGCFRADPFLLSGTSPGPPAHLTMQYQTTFSGAT